mgnify:FL=1
MIVSTVLIVGLAILTTTLLIFSGAIVVTNSPISRQSVVDDASVYASTNQTAIDQFIDNIDISLDPSIQTTTTPKFTILTNLVLFDSNNREYPKTIPTNVELAKNSLVDDQGRLLDLGSVQFTFDGIGTIQNKNLEITATALFCLDTKCDEKKLYRQGTLQNNKISLYVGDYFIEPALGQRKFDYTFSFANEGKEWTDGSSHSIHVILKDITFRNFTTDEKWFFVGEDEIYNLKMIVNQQKTVVYDEQLKQAITIFKKDNIFSSCAGGAKGIASTGSAYGSSGGSSSPAPVPEITFKVNGEPFGSIPYHNDGGQLPPIPIGLHSGSYNGADTCKTLNLPRNAEVIATIENQDYKFFTPKAQQNFFIKCSNDLFGIGSVYYGGSYRPSYYEPKLVCNSNIGFSK